MENGAVRWGFCAGLSALLALSGCNWIEARGATGPNVLLVTIDTLRADHVGSYGRADAETPTLDRLAAEGVRFERAVATVPLTLPSHVSILTGQYPPTHGIRHNAIFRLRDEAETVAERFHAAGVETGAVIGAAVLDASFGLAQGFDHYDAKLPEDRAGAAGFFERPAAEVTDAALAWLRSRDGRFFLWVHYYDVHGPYAPPEPYKTRFAKRPYDGEVAYVDHQLGRLLAALEASGQRANTIVAVTSDHGEGLGEHGESTHSYLIYDSVLHVPLLLAGPGLPAGRRVSSVVSNAGVAATLVRLAGLPPLAKTDVGDLTPLFAAAPEETTAVAPGWAYAETLAGELDHGWAPIHAIRSDDYHYIRAPRPELFEVARDPGQLTNLLSEESAETAAPVARAERAITELLSGSQAQDTVAVDAATRERIEALGYVVPTGAVAKNGADPKDVHRLADRWIQALALLFAKKYAEAERVALAGLEKMPNSSQLHEVLARIYIETHREELALTHALETARLNPAWSDHQALVAYICLRLGDRERALAAFERAAELDPEHPGAQVGLMWKRRVGGSLEETEEHARRALASGGDRPAIWERVGEVWEMLGEYERAFAVYEEGLERYPDYAPLHMRLAIQYARQGDERRAASAQEKAGAAARDMELRNRLGVVYAARRDYERAEPIFREVLAERPYEPSTRRLLARMLRETGRAGEAEELTKDVAPGAEVLAPKPPSDLAPRG